MVEGLLWASRSACASPYEIPPTVVDLADQLDKFLLKKHRFEQALIRAVKQLVEAGRAMDVGESAEEVARVLSLPAKDMRFWFTVWKAFRPHRALPNESKQESLNRFFFEITLGESEGKLAEDYTISIPMVRTLRRSKLGIPTPWEDPEQENHGS